MTAPTSLIDLLLNLLRDPAALKAFQQNPDAFLTTCGYGDVSAQDIHDALVLNLDSHEAGLDRAHQAAGHVQIPPPPHPAPGESHHEAAVRYLNTYITNNYIDDRDTNVDNSLHQNIDNRGGHFDQDIGVHSTVASGDGAVAAGGDIKDSTVTTGDGNVVGHDNKVVHGDHDTTAFGSGDATSTTVGGNVTVGAGAAFASGGNAAVDNSDTSLHNVGNHNITNSGNDLGDHSLHNVGNTVTDHSTHDSHDTSIDDSFNNPVDNSAHDSGNVGIELHV